MSSRRTKPAFESTDWVNEEQVGLVLPNGRIVWPPNDYKGRPIATQEDRARMLEVLKASAVDLDFEEDKFLSQYQWATRRVETGQLWPITLDDFVTVEEEQEKRVSLNGHSA